MKNLQIPFQEIPQLSKTDIAYASKSTDLENFISYSADIHSFTKVIEDRKQYPIDRNLLVSVFKKQYSKLETSIISSKNIDALNNENTFTVITAHQPSLLLGPLYFVYKIISAIKLAQQLNDLHQNNHIVPVFIIGGEDHDFDEVNHINLFNKKITWQNEEKGSVGMMQTESLQTVLSELKTLVGDSENAREIYRIFEKNYTQFSVYHDATQAIINDLFGRFGLLVLNMNDAELKRAFSPIIEQELVAQPSINFVQKTQNELSSLGYKSQAFPREINLFYLDNQVRERIVFEDNVYKVLNTNILMTKNKILELLKSNPEKFSPNVVMRPLFQETILPNLAYIGGGGEIAYWLERKTQFAHFNVFYPMLIRRNSVLFLDKNSNERLTKFSLSALDLFQDQDFIVRKYINENSDVELNLTQEKKEIEAIFEKIKLLASKVDVTLEKTIVAESIKQSAVIVQLESRLVRAEKQKQETSLNQIKALMQKACPNGGLQERFENFIPYYIKFGASFFDMLLAELNPITESFDILIEE